MSSDNSKTASPYPSPDPRTSSEPAIPKAVYNDEEQLLLSVWEGILQRSKEIVILVLAVLAGFYLYSRYEASTRDQQAEATRRLALVTERLAALETQSTSSTSGEAVTEAETDRAKQQELFTEAVTLLKDVNAPQLSRLSMLYSLLSGGGVTSESGANEPLKLGAPPSGRIDPERLVTELTLLTQIRGSLASASSGKESSPSADTFSEARASLVELVNNSQVVAPIASKLLLELARTPEEKANAVETVDAMVARLPFQRDIVSEDLERARVMMPRNE